MHEEIICKLQKVIRLEMIRIVIINFCLIFTYTYEQIITKSLTLKISLSTLLDS